MLLHDRPWSFQNFPRLRFCRLHIDTQELLPLAAAVAGLPSLDLHLRILDGDGDAADVVRGLAALADHVIGLDLDKCIVFIESVVGCLPLLRRLDAVDISRQGGTEWALGHLRQQEPRLQRLDCFYNELDDACLPLLASFTNLTWLDVSSNHIRHVRFVAGMPRLRILDLKATDVYDLQPLAAVPSLEQLNLAHRRAPNGPELESLFGLQTLKLVDLSANVRIQPESVAGLRAALPGCKVLYGPQFEP
jgi:Leucine-rich repeat (LRR) protein